ncbi:hypothetical protein QBZ16_005374 [Prototheca wickerhamii]|uniref:WW domain-containing protein n=1 Tax=Prototheca wickerhamii TaxID=3111 RepID=A0AAD9IGB6_PROWI|nr:hypothetical protein QBZ16_005374 [Prototheca wickerhamii]
MTTRWTLAVALVCIVALASVPGGDAFWGKKKTLEAKATPSPDPVQEPAPAVVNDITYYIDPVTKASSYEKPASLDWRSYEDDQHQTYYANAQTGESTYSIPAMLAWRRFATEQHSEL